LGSNATGIRVVAEKMAQLPAAGPTASWQEPVLPTLIIPPASARFVDKSDRGRCATAVPAPALVVLPTALAAHERPPVDLCTGRRCQSRFLPRACSALGHSGQRL